ncbi:hypothetical protein ACFWQG_19565 [Rhodococcus sp. NPDC058532]|uniref:hypothetical protein n=1 Tax=Rhodococcus sp. NPDC058532 TaxID=3346540 RepID=UPI00364CA86C
MDDELNAALDLPQQIEPGEFAFTFMVDAGDGPSAQDITFTWDGSSSATWRQDISEHGGDLSPASSSPAYGWISWYNGTGLLVAYGWPDLNVDGWAHLPGAAPGTASAEVRTASDSEDALLKPWTWVLLARAIVHVLHGNYPPGATGDSYG